MLVHLFMFTLQDDINARLKWSQEQDGDGKMKVNLG